MPRPPKDVAKLKLAGTYRADRHEGREHMTPEPGDPPKPDILEGEAVTEWHRVVAELRKTGVLTQLDRAALAIYCNAWARWTKAEREIRDKGEIVASRNGEAMRNPWLGVSEKSAAIMKTFGEKLGLSPVARKSITVRKQTEQTGKARFFNKASGA